MDNYKKIQIVGKGSFGNAILVQSILTQRFYVMKIIDLSQMNKQQREEALNEVILLKSLSHPFIIKYIESFLDKNRFLCIVMEYADHGDLYQVICEHKKKGKRISEEEIINWFIQICFGIKYIHDKKIMHRDLKSQNIFLTKNGQIKIGDFGIAKTLQDNLDWAKTAIGTPYYLSPEIYQEKPYNFKSDIWSLGCILYELLTLRHAFDAHNMQGLIVKILRGKYPLLPVCYSQELRDIIGQLLTKEPAQRPSIENILNSNYISQKSDLFLYKQIQKQEEQNKNNQKVSNIQDSQINCFLKDCQLISAREQQKNDNQSFGDDLQSNNLSSLLKNDCLGDNRNNQFMLQPKFDESSIDILQAITPREDFEEQKLQ